MKMHILSNCLADLGHDDGPEHCEAGKIINMPADTAHMLARIGRALYVDAKNDPSDSKIYTYATPWQAVFTRRHGEPADPAGTKKPPKAQDNE